MSLSDDERADLAALLETRRAKGTRAADAMAYQDSPQAQALVHRAFLTVSWPVKARHVAAQIPDDDIDGTYAGKVLAVLADEGLAVRAGRHDVSAWEPTAEAWPTDLERRFWPEHPVRKQVVRWLFRECGPLKSHVRAREVASDLPDAKSKTVGLVLTAMYRRPTAAEPVTVADVAEASTAHRYRIEIDR